MGRDVAKQRKFQREWVAKRRKDWFETNGPCVKCGSWDQLELDHINPEEKEHHNIWSWREERRLAEIAKCQVLCHVCHLEKTKQSRRVIHPHGTTSRYWSSWNPCKCQECRAANAAYKQNQREELKAKGIKRKN